jgi:catechol 2,3-dioxygenase-like lactoylglutathione lyase family enzyme
MITGAHVIVYSKNDEADRAFFRDVLGLPSVDAGRGWLIFGVPAGEVAFHPAEAPSHELYFLVEDVDAFVAQMGDKGVATTPVQEQRWGRITEVTLPSGGKLGVYQPKHPRP